MSKANDYKKYLKSLHSQKETPEEIIREIVKEGIQKRFVSKKKIVAGEVNEVYDITLSDKSHVILRVSPNGSPDFQQEQWSMEAAKKVSVPVPEIYLVKYITINGKEYGFCLMEKLEGDTLERGKIDFDKLALKERKDYIIQAGAILTKIHSIPTVGWGWIVKNKGQYKTSDELFVQWLNKREEYLKAAKEENIEKQVINKALKVVEDFKEKYKSIKPRLAHSDFAHKHFMVKDRKVVGILDWGGVRSDSPVYDFANWDFWFGENIPTKWLMEGYTNKDLFDDNFEDFLHFIRIEKGLENLNWYNKQKYKEMIEKIKAKLIKDVEYFS